MVGAVAADEEGEGLRGRRGDEKRVQVSSTHRGGEAPMGLWKWAHAVEAWKRGVGRRDATRTEVWEAEDRQSLLGVERG